MNTQSVAMATQMSETFAASATETQGQAMQTLHAMQHSHAVQSGNLIDQMAQASKQAMESMKSVVTEVLRMQNPPPTRPLSQVTEVFRWLFRWLAQGSRGPILGAGL